MTQVVEKKTTKKEKIEIEKLNAVAIEKALVEGDLSALSTEQRISYYKRTCESLGLNPLTKPFGYIRLNGKLILYALKDCTDQIRNNKGVSVTALDGKIVDDLYIVTATGKNAQGRVDCATGAVQIKGLFGESKANAIMKAETKAKRRLTLSMCGLGMLDEAEIESIPGAQIFTEDAKISVDAKEKTIPPSLPPASSVKPKSEAAIALAPKSTMNASDAAAKMKAAAPPAFHKVEPAVVPAKSLFLEICDCGAPGAEHSTSGCMIKGCDCPGFEKAMEVSPDRYENENVNGHLKMYKPGDGPKLMVLPQSVEQWLLAFSECDSTQRLTYMYNNDVPKDWRNGKLTEAYGKRFNELKAKAKAPVATK